ncbi:hypothetical protein [uncultured Roseibium sp.]|uniref:hypothetical protein n=1 Tax=uncultured Roseibium sp. TaxID=1936171 RepID=UPI002621E795|nr:hypothetical protein [uncultured Roseibium sp.]
MRICLLFPLILMFCCPSWAAEPYKGSAADKLVLPAQGTSVDLKSGEVSRKGVSGQCLEQVSQAGHHQLVVEKMPGDDAPAVTLNKIPVTWISTIAGEARLGSLKLSRGGSLFALRKWKTGDKQTELLQDGQVVLTWKRGSAVKLLQVRTGDVAVLEERTDQATKLFRYRRNSNGDITTDREELVDFGSCKPGRLRLKDNILWSWLDCDGDDRKGIYRISLQSGEIGLPVISDPYADFVTMPKAFKLSEGETVAIVDGTSAAKYFHFALNGLLLSQTGEVRACSSDAEGLQSWNQSYRLRALATLYAKTGASVFSDLARKSIRLSLSASDGKTRRAGSNNPSCGWSSTIYGSEPGKRLSLMINQAMISNALSASCDLLGSACPTHLAYRITAASMCLVKHFEPQLDAETGLYRIDENAGFRFAGSVAPWNWQIAFAEVLDRINDDALQLRAHQIAMLYLNSWKSTSNGALWRYWPDAYYREKGLDDEQFRKQRFEDTGHAGISLLSLGRLVDQDLIDGKGSVGDRLDYLLSFGTDTPRDLDGKGPRSGRWFPSGGWANFATDRFKAAMKSPVPGARSADALYAYVALFDPDEPFHLTVDIFVCADICRRERQLTYESWQSYLTENPFFQLRQSEARSESEITPGEFFKKSNFYKP